MKWIFGNGDENICRNNISTSNFKVRVLVKFVFWGVVLGVL